MPETQLYEHRESERARERERETCTSVLIMKFRKSLFHLLVDYFPFLCHTHSYMQECQVDNAHLITLHGIEKSVTSDILFHSKLPRTNQQPCNVQLE